MPKLSLSVLGPFVAYLDERPLTQFRTKATQALLIYLACQPETAHRREQLMTLLWPGLPKKSAQANLRQTLYQLRQVLSETAVTDDDNPTPFLLSDWQTIQINPEAPYEVDVLAFESMLQEREVRWGAAIKLYRGDFLGDFYLPDSALFEEWVAARRGDLRRQVLAALDTLTTKNIQSGKLDTAESYARRQLEIDNLRESAHRQLMEVLARNGRRQAALSHYETCRQLLYDELDIEPTSEMQALYESIRSANFLAPDSLHPIPPAPLPAFLTKDAPDRETAVFVAREQALHQLDEQLQISLSGRGRVIFIAGEAGSGKSALLAEFARHAHAALPELLIAHGVCSAYTGVGDPLLPFRDVLAMLTGDVESQWRAGTITGEQARSLWAFLPLAIPILLKHGPNLIDLLIPGASLLTRSQTAVPDASWLGELIQVTEKGKEQASNQKQSQLFELVVNVLQAMAAERPLLLMLDDLQWADTASLNLLFHLGRRLGNDRLLILGTYRSDEIALERSGERHPLEPLRNEFRRIFGEDELNLNEVTATEGRAFVDAYLDNEPNNLDENFRRALVRHTGGQALFVIELLRDLQGRGELVQDEHGRWTSTSAFSWDALPARVEGIIAERLSRLELELQQLLAVASVEGQEFTLQVIAHVQQMDERPLLRTLSQELEKRHGLIQTSAEERIGDQYLTCYRFSHALFQQYLYGQLSPAERRLLHGEIGKRLENLYQNQTESILAQLAYHFSEASEAEKAVEYLLLAGDRARGLYAHDEAAPLYEQALLFLKELGAYEQAARTQMKLGLTHHLAFNYRQARRAYEDGFLLWRQAERKQASTPLLPAPHPLQMPWLEPTTLDPMFLKLPRDTIVSRHLFSSLVGLGPEMEIVPEVAQSWEVSEDGCRYTFHLRDDVRWSDDVPVTAQDYAYAWKRQLQPNNDVLNAVMLFDISNAQAYHEGDLTSVDQVGIQTANDTTLIVELEQPASNFLYKVAGFLPVPQHTVEAWGPTWTELGHLVSNGPFLLTSWQSKKVMTLVRNPKYYGQSLGNLNRVDLLFHLNRFTRLSGYDEGKLDIIEAGVSPQGLDLARQRYANEYISLPWPRTTYVKFDEEQAPFADPRVRRAFVMALDREILADVDLNGYRFPATGGFVPLGIPGHSPEIGLAYDPEQACVLLAAAGFPNGKGFPKVLAQAGDGGLFVHVRESLHRQWQDILGISINWQPVKWTELGEEPSQILLVGWRSYFPDPAYFLEALIHSNRWPNKTYETMLETAARSTNHTERIKLYQAADKFLVNEAVFVPITYGRRHYLVKPWIKNFVSGEYRWQDIIIEPH